MQSIKKYYSAVRCNAMCAPKLSKKLVRSSLDQFVRSQKREKKSELPFSSENVVKAFNFKRHMLKQPASEA